MIDPLSFLRLQVSSIFWAVFHDTNCQRWAHFFGRIVMCSWRWSQSFKKATSLFGHQKDKRYQKYSRFSCFYFFVDFALTSFSTDFKCLGLQSPFFVFIKTKRMFPPSATRALSGMDNHFFWWECISNLVHGDEDQCLGMTGKASQKDTGFFSCLVAAFS